MGANELILKVVDADNGISPLVFPVDRVFNAGWAGRDRAEVELHIRELEAQGVPRPTRVPDCFELSADRVQLTDRVQVLSPDSSGEVEYVLWILGDKVYVGVGSDHTDRGLEAVSVPLSKQLYPNVVSDTVWPLDAVRDHWAQLTLRCWTHEPDGTRALYQEGSVDLLIDPWFWLERIREAGAIEDGRGTVFFSGTVSALGGLRPAGGYSLSLVDPVRNQTLEAEYRVEQVLETVL